MFKKFIQWLLGRPKVYTTTFPGPDTIYYYMHSTGKVEYFDTLEELIKFHED